MKNKFAATLLALTALFASTSCSQTQVSDNAGERTEALDSSVWKYSRWISAADAPVVTGAITSDNERAADGASWFVSSLKNDRKVIAAKWMTAGLGVYDLYVNGKL
ncbi:MAG: glycosyl hydrolase family 18, partial [Muribaculaceae bacterium]|nr:glycosyl hydrolase family 18 [Muribaculaceae bacterium]